MVEIYVIYCRCFAFVAINDAVIGTVRIRHRVWPHIIYTKKSNFLICIFSIFGIEREAEVYSDENHHCFDIIITDRKSWHVTNEAICLIKINHHWNHRDYSIFNILFKITTIVSQSLSKVCEKYEEWIKWRWRSELNFYSLIALNKN